jgi:hypothetical protein
VYLVFQRPLVSQPDKPSLARSGHSSSLGTPKKHVSGALDNDLPGLQHAVSKVTEDTRGAPFIKCARRLEIVCLMVGLSRYLNTEKHLWGEAPAEWETQIYRYKAPATQDVFLQPYLTDLCSAL